MARPKTISDEQILQAAYSVFVDQGFQVPTSVIAKAAGVSEGTIFKRFPTKAALFFAAMGVPQWQLAERLDQRVGEGDFREQVSRIGEEVVAYFRTMVPRVMALCTQPGCSPVDVFNDDEDAPPVRMLAALTRYFGAEMAAGRLDVADPEIIARVFLGSLHNFVFFELIGVRSADPLTSDAFITALVDLLAPPSAGTST